MTRDTTLPASSAQARSAATSAERTREESGAQSESGVGEPQIHDRRGLLELFASLVDPLAQALPTCEVVLHDLAKLPNSIIAVHGSVTGRRVGDPATDLLLEQLAADEIGQMVGYATELPDGRQLRSTTLIIRDARDEPVAALCINTDLSIWRSMAGIAAAMLGHIAPNDGAAAMAPPTRRGLEPANEEPGPSEVFARDVDELASHLVHQAMAEHGIPVDLMKKEHKLAVVRSLKARGMFMLRDAVEMVASSLHVTRFTIYNYLNEIEGEENDSKGLR